jgi:hypothetical protein
MAMCSLRAAGRSGWAGSQVGPGLLGLSNNVRQVTACGLQSPCQWPFPIDSGDTDGAGLERHWLGAQLGSDSDA